MTVIRAAVVLLISAIVAAVIPAARAARVDVIQALRADLAAVDLSVAPGFSPGTDLSSVAGFSPGTVARKTSSDPLRKLRGQLTMSREILVQS
ncbi:MAG: hypothetical protein ACRD8A_06090 [Candidatus Acidiferrales bacterium]